MFRIIPTLLLSFFLTQVSLASYAVLRDYSGADFFSAWNFYGGSDAFTLGNVQFLSQPDAAMQGLALVNNAGNAIIRVDNSSTVQSNANRSSVRLTSIDSYPTGSLWIIDALHIPFGCSVWPSFWSSGPQWPNDSQIDTIEAVNLMTQGQMSLHARNGCFQAPNATQTGQSASKNCTQDTGCVVGITTPNSIGATFAAAGGGVFATQFDASGIFIWFWSRPNIPTSIKQSSKTSTIEISDWGTPTASYPSSGCNVTQYFGPQTLNLEINLCGNWAGTPEVYNQTCGRASGPTGLCYADNVMGVGSPKYDNAYFEISFIRAYFPAGSTAQISRTTDTAFSSTPTGTSSNPKKSSSFSTLSTFRRCFFIYAFLVMLRGLLIDAF